jgi:hypothetical protein
MMDVEIIGKGRDSILEIGEWLDSKMPNPPLPDPQRWSLGYNEDGSRIRVRFLSERDALHFMMRWSE